MPNQVLPFERKVTAWREGYEKDPVALGSDAGVTAIRTQIQGAMSEPLAAQDFLQRLVSLLTGHASTQVHAPDVWYEYIWDEVFQRWTKVCHWNAQITVADVGQNPAVINVHDQQTI